VTRARNGDKQAWDALVERYAPLIWSICRRHGLGGADTEDVAQNVWLKLVNRLGTLRDPAALPGWLATTTRRECARVLRMARGPHDAGRAPDAEIIPDEQAVTPEQELLAAERHAALREALAQQPPCCQKLIALLLEDPLCHTPRSAPGWASRPAASGRTAAAAWTSCAATRLSQH
jgi:RNA polymerase sigma factor (sigma-70 family)